MEPNASGSTVKKQEDPPEDSKPPKQDVKPVVKTLNRVPRACNACRKQKMRCEGADNPPCRRCRHAGLECLFEKPSREATLTGEAGLERIRSLEAHVADIRHTQTSMHNILSEIVSHLRNGAYHARSPSAYPQYHNQSPSMHSPSLATPPAGHQHINDMSGSSSSSSFSSTHSALITQSQRQARGPMSNQSYQSPQTGPISPTVEYHPPQIPPSSYAYQTVPQQQQPYPANAANNNASGNQGQVLPPFSSISTTMGPPAPQQSNVRYNPGDSGRPPRPHSSATKRHAPPSSNVTSADSSDAEDDDNGELPASGLVAPWEVLRGLADVAIRRAAKDAGESSEPQSRTRTPSPDRQMRPAKRRKIRHKGPSFPDVVTKNIISEHDARELFRIFYHGCSTFLPVFDANTDTYEALHERSPFAVDCICMVAAKVRDGGGKPSEAYIKCLDEVQKISCATLFSPVTRHEAVQAMILVSGWSDNGWLSGGHAIRMAMELSMHKAWPRLYRRMQTNKVNTVEDRNLVIASRTWFCLYLFEHQLSYGTGRPAVLKDDESIAGCRMMLQHPLAIEDDMRLVSTVELMALRERLNNQIINPDGPLNEAAFAALRDGSTQFQTWFATWDQAFSQKYEDAAFYRQSLQIQQVHAELFHNATALRGINGPDDVQKMPPVQRELAMRSIQIARQGLDITVNSPSYREGMKYAVHYTHATATFTASFLLRLSRLFPNECNVQEIRSQVERLAELMSQIPAKRYALTLQVMLKRAKKRKDSQSLSPKATRDPQQRMPVRVDHSGGIPVQHRPVENFSPTYEHAAYPPEMQAQQHMHQSHHHTHHHPDAVNQMHGHHTHPMHGQPQLPMTADADNIWRSFNMTSNEQLPVWVSDQTLGGNAFTQSGMDAFLLPTEYLPGPTIW
ncbi:hypothetical protein EYR40_003832 [Pleurotus pulmonarius]|nr:hypothetical protein EYR40_003832 [Pleurotus pulmonarius]KAF4606542.1 hypothetical protein EYR38_000596 [Pleurotus pulmonarius]